MSGLGLIFAWLGVYNTGQLPFYKSFIFWTTTMAVGAGTSVLIGPYIWGPRYQEVGAIFKIGVASAIISVPVTLVLVLFFAPGSWEPVRLISQYTYVLVIALIVTSAAYVRSVLSKSDDAVIGEEADGIATFLERLPIKYRTSDAVRELARADGLQVHRSWWVAKAGIQDEKRLDGRSLLVLPSGTEVPVSRSYRAKAKEAGLIR